MVPRDPPPYKISTLIFIRNGKGELLLMRRRKRPNQGLWSCIGGKLEMASGESPFEAAQREVKEEIGLELNPGDLHLFCMIAEKAYEGGGHWLMFLFNCGRPLQSLPPPIEEGEFSFFPPEEIERLPIPDTDRQALWPLWMQYRSGFTCLRADCSPATPLSVVVEQQMPGPEPREKPADPAPGSRPEPNIGPAPA